MERAMEGKLMCGKNTLKTSPLLLEQSFWEAVIGATIIASSWKQCKGWKTGDRC